MSNEELVQLIRKGENISDNMSKLYVQNKGLIFKVVKKYSYVCKAGYGGTSIIELEELMNEAYFGLVKAVESFEVGQGILFMSYAPYWIRQSIKRYLEDSGQIIRVPVHIQEKVYRYNQVSSYYMHNFNRQPSKEEFSSVLQMSAKAIEQLQRFMYQHKVSSLDTVTTEGEDDMNLSDSLPCDINIEEEVVEKVMHQQLKRELWEVITQILQDEKKIQLLKLRFINKMNMETIGKRFDISRACVRQTIEYCLKLIRRNTQIRQMAVQTGIWDADKPFTEERIIKLCKLGFYGGLDEKEFRYAKQKGWVMEEQPGREKKED